MSKSVYDNSDIFMYHYVDVPKLWTKPRSKIYDMNRMYGEYFYQPMLEYVKEQELTGDLYKSSKAATMANILSRKEVSLPNGHELSASDVYNIPIAPARLGPFLSTYRAKQIKELNSNIVHVKCEMMRDSKATRTLPDRRTSTLIRNQYIRDIADMHSAGV